MAVTSTSLFLPRFIGTARELRELPPLIAGGRPSTRVHLLAPSSDGDRLATRYGLECGKHGAYFQLDASVDLAKIPAGLLPFYARPKLTPFISDLPPANSWGGSLAALLTSSSLTPLAESAAKKFAGKCYFCGAPDLSPHGPAHHARPWWGYAEPVVGESFGRQYLLALTPMCLECADMLRMARASEHSRFDPVRARVAAAFRFTEEEALHYFEIVEQRWARNSGHFWAADLSHVFGGATLQLQAAWQHNADSSQEDPILFRAAGTNAQSASLQLRGVKYQVSGSHRVHVYL